MNRLTWRFPKIHPQAKYLQLSSTASLIPIECIGLHLPLCNVYRHGFVNVIANAYEISSKNTMKSQNEENVCRQKRLVYFVLSLLPLCFISRLQVKKYYETSL